MITMTKHRRATRNPTVLQAETYRVIVDFIRKNGAAPSITQVSTALGLKARSANDRIQGLVARGWLRPASNAPRMYLPVFDRRCECCGGPVFREFEQ